jgi:hypothetical protein
MDPNVPYLESLENSELGQEDCREQSFLPFQYTWVNKEFTEI